MGRDRDESRFLAEYDPGAFPRPSVTVDIVIVTVVDAHLDVLLVKRKEHPFKGSWALPGGFVRVGDARHDQGEDLDAAAVRELEEETGLAPESVFLEQLGAFGRAGRDPRMRVITVAYFAIVRPDLAPLVRAGGDASATAWRPVSELGRARLAFDHREIIDAALAHVARRIDDGGLLRHLVPGTFTIPELRVVRGIVLGKEQDAGNFRRRFQRMVEDGSIELAPGKRVTASKPAAVYRFPGRGRPS
jgi:8-oxo-dGTP diphosphatase